jgi:glycosyltransferase involved in cell wall biosynthesis
LKKLIIGIDASTVGSGGAKRHLIEFLDHLNPIDHNFNKIIIWGNKSFLDSLCNYPWLEKKPQNKLDKNLFLKVFWHLFCKEKIINKSKISILFSPFGTYTGKFRPYVTMSRNMLVFDKVEKKRLSFFSTLRLKLLFLYYIQKKSFKNASGIIFISNFAKNIILKEFAIRDKFCKIIHHGVSRKFQSNIKNEVQSSTNFNLLYVSSIWPYKYHLNVIKSVTYLNNSGYSINLKIVGSPDCKRTSKLLRKYINSLNNNKFIEWYENIGLDEVDKFYLNADGFIFASSCENMPNILIEAMASGLPICCSNIDPMPEFIKDAAIYFKPQILSSIIDSLKILIEDVNLRNHISVKSKKLSLEYNWQKCTNETIDFITKTYKNS